MSHLTEYRQFVNWQCRVSWIKPVLKGAASKTWLRRCSNPKVLSPLLSPDGP